MDAKDGKTRGIVEDVSGRVVWTSSDTTVAKVGNMLTYDPESRRAAAKDGRWVSTWYAPITFSKADTEVTISANWNTTLGDDTLSDSSRIKITQASSGQLMVPPVQTGLCVSPGNFVWGRMVEADGSVFCATGSMSDRTLVDPTNTVEWSLYTVQVDASGAEIGTTPFPGTYGDISQGGVNTVGGMLRLTNAAESLPPTRLRIQARQASTGFVEKADVLLQFNNQ